MKVYILASGSKGNSIIIKDKTDIICLDLGITYKKIADKLKAEEIKPDNVKHILITHEHMDHSKGIKVFSKKQIDTCFYLTAGTKKALLKQGIEILSYKIIKADTKYIINNFEVTPICLSHDALEPVGFFIKKGDKKIVYITDTGYIPEEYDSLLKDATLYIVEANHDVTTLMSTNLRPHHIKMRIISEKGHMSNDYISMKLNDLITEKAIWAVAHISEDCNSIDLIEKAICKNFDNPNKVETFYTSQETVKINL